MQTTRKIDPGRSTRTTFYLSERATVAGYSYIGETTEGAFAAGVSGVLARMWDMLKRDGAGEGTVLVDRAAAYALGLRADSPGEALANARSSGWNTSRDVGMWTAFYAEGRPSIYIGQLDELLVDADDDPGRWPFDGRQPVEMVAQLQRWHELTGITWQATPAVMGIELMHRTLPGYRLPGVKGVHRPAKKDLHTPADAGEAMWTPKLWRRPMADVSRETSGAGNVVYLHKYDKSRAGLTAAGVAKLCPPQLQRTGKLPYDPKRAGWWLISVPPWNEPRLPHPCGPGAIVWERRWVTTATMDLLAELAELGEVDMPEVIDSLTGPARPLLLPWVRVLEEAYDAELGPDYYPDDRAALRAAVKEVGTRGVGMLAHMIDGKPASTIYRPDWFSSVNATKRANGYRVAYKIGKGEGRWPVWIDDDSIVYASDSEDPYSSAPATFSAQIGDGRRRQLDGDQPGDYRVQETITATRRAAA